MCACLSCKEICMFFLMTDFQNQGCDWVFKCTPLILNICLFATRPSPSIPHKCSIFSFLWVLYRVVPLLGRPPPTVRWRGTGHSRATRPHGEVRGTGVAGPGSIFAPETVERPQRGLGRNPSLLLSARRLIGTALDWRMHE